MTDNNAESHTDLDSVSPTEAISQARSVVRSVSRPELQPTMVEDPTKARAISLTLGIVGALALMGLARALFTVSGTVLGALLWMVVATTTTIAALYLSAGPSRYRDVVLQPVALLFVAGCDRDEVVEVVIAAQNREQLAVNCRLYLQQR